MISWYSLFTSRYDRPRLLHVLEAPLPVPHVLLGVHHVRDVGGVLYVEPRGQAERGQKGVDRLLVRVSRWAR